MSEEAFLVSLAGRQWFLPHLPFRAIKKIQPALFQIYAELGGAAISTASVARLSEAQLDRLAEATYQAITHVDPELSREDFLDLPFSVSELMQAFPAIARAAGLRAATASEASRREAPGELISTG
ncbi:hypothetical protein [Methylocapsa sp. S129]|uniref:hypothetical protein n=1 Tax=Methylocapsa sp. S129 TaxID=1641869 RepID=UPI00131AB164|nr:hypothetical protein [Methylocapsa sp. S129]